MATLVQILIAAILSLLGINPDAQEKMPDKEEKVIESALQTHNSPIYAEHNEYREWDVTTKEPIEITIAK